MRRGGSSTGGRKRLWPKSLFRVQADEWRQVLGAQNLKHTNSFRKHDLPQSWALTHRVQGIWWGRLPLTMKVLAPPYACLLPMESLVPEDDLISVLILLSRWTEEGWPFITNHRPGPEPGVQLNHWLAQGTAVFPEFRMREQIVVFFSRSHQ